ncbi:MAG: hypothetical protein KY445_05665 [Armatimonadetes bacterium]|nr:hypothetical protein [Armatimonadota bacterium]
MQKTTATPGGLRRGRYGSLLRESNKLSTEGLSVRQTQGMKRADSSDQTVRVANQEFRWRVHRQPQWCTADGWKGLALHVELAREPQRTLIIEFPFKVINHRNEPGKQRPKVTRKDVIVAISAALEAGWNPESRGKKFVFEMTDEA